MRSIGSVKRRFFDNRFRRAEPVVARAVERGELPTDADPAELVKALVAPIYFRLVIAAEPIDERTADLAARAALAAARAGALSPRKTPRTRRLHAADRRVRV
jgi:hypothetical protein